MRRSVLLVALLLLAPAARAEDAAARAQFLRDGDAKALADRLAASGDARDRDALALARLAADPAARPPAGAGARAACLDALRMGDLAAARAAGTLGSTVPEAWLGALLDARGGSDEAALARIRKAGAPDLARDAFDLALLGAALPADDRDVLEALVSRSVVREAVDGRHDLVDSLARAAAAWKPKGSLEPAVIAVRALRRAGREDAAAALLASLPAECPELRLERALLAWRKGDGPGARAAVATPPEGVAWPWAFAALARAEGAPRVAAAPGLELAEPTSDPNALAAARVLTLLGAPTRAGEIASRATAASLAMDDPRLPARLVEGIGGGAVALAGDSASVREALDQGLVVVLWWPRRRADGFADHPVVLRGHDRATGLCVADDPDPDRLDAVPVSWAGKARALVAAPPARRTDVGAFANRPSCRLGSALVEALAAPAGEETGNRIPRLTALASSPESAPVVDLYLAYATYGPAILAKDAAARARAGALVRRSSVAEPAFAFERFVRSMEASTQESAVETAARDLLEAGLLEGPAPYLETARFVQYETARRHEEASRSLAAALALDPLDVRSLYFRASARRLLGDARGARADLVRVLDRRPDTLAAAEDLSNLFLEEGELLKALAVVEALAKADPEGAKGRRVRQLRQRAEIRLARRARSVADLLPLVQSPEAETRREVAWAVASFESAEAETVLRRLLDDPDEAVRRKTAQAYNRPWLLDRAAADATLTASLVAHVGSDASPVVREALAVALGRVPTDAASSALVARLAGPNRETEGPVRAAVIEAVSATDKPYVRRALVGALADEDAVARSAAIRALARMAGTDRGFHAEDPPEKRAEALAAWQRWLADGAE